MTQRPLVSIITGSIPNRHDELVAAMANIQEQTYPNIEHCIAVEGATSESMHRLEAVTSRMSCTVPTRVTALPRWWSRFLTNSISTVPYQVAQWMAAGEYLMWMADDERMLVPDHIEALVDLLESGPYDFVSPLVQVYYADRPDEQWVVGVDPPENGTITHALYRASLLDVAGFRPHVGSGSDWDQVERWLDADARFALLPRVTYSHKTDKMPWMVENRG